MEKNKWLMALAGMSLQLSIGSIYAYSVWVAPLEKINHWDVHQLKLAFSLAICFLGLTAAFMGSAVQKMGPRKGGLLGAAFFGIGLAGAGFAASVNSLPAFYMFYGVVSGIGLGFGYITPVSCVVKWFPEKPGLASGLVIMSFAAGSIIASQVISPLVASLGVPHTFYLLATVYAFIMLFASLYLEVPQTTAAPLTDDHDHSSGSKVHIGQLLKDVRFYGLWSMLFFNTVCGIALIAVAAPMAKEIVHISDSAAVIFVGIIGLFNGLGRLFWSSLSDKIGRWATFMCFFIIGAVCFTLLAHVTNAWLFQTLVFIIISCYGGAFATMPAFIKDIYGPDKLGSVFGYVLTAWAAAAFAGPWLITLDVDFSVIFYLFALILALTAFLTLWLKSRMKTN